MAFSRGLDGPTSAAKPGANTAIAAASIVVPVYNSKASLPRLIATIRAIGESSFVAFEIVLVDDASTDGSAAAVRALQQHAANIVVVENPVNRGQSKATTTGIQAASHDVVITLDDDLQHAPQDILRLLEPLAGATPRTLVIGVAASFKRPLWRGLAGIGSNLVSNLFLARAIPLQLTTFCAFRRPLCDQLDPNAVSDFALVTELVQAADHVVTVPVQSNRATQRSSRYTLRTLLRLFLSRSRCYSLTRVLIGLGVSLSLMAAGVALAVAQSAPAYLVIAGAAAAVSAMLAWLAIKVRRDQRAAGVTRADRRA